MITEKNPGYILCLLTILFVILLPLTKTSDFDLFFHLRIGELTFEEGSLQRSDELSYTAPGHRLYLGDWLSNLLLYITYKTGGWPGLAALKTVLFSLTMFFVLKACLLMAGGRSLRPAADSALPSGVIRQTGRGYVGADERNAYLIAAALVVTGLSLRFRLNLRPYYFSFLFLSIFMCLFLKYRKDGRPGLLYFLPLIQAVWANTHGSSIIGPGFTALFFLTETIRKRGMDVRLGLVLLGVIAAAGISPEGFRVYSLYLPFLPEAVTGSSGALSLGRIDEWSAVTPGMLWGYGMRYTLPFQIIAAGSLIFLVISAFKRKRVDVFYTIVFAGCVFYSMRHIRLMDISSIALSPLFYGFLCEAADFLTKKRRLLTGRLMRGLRAGIIPVLGISVVIVGFFSIFRSPIYSFGIGPKAGIFPERQLRFLDSHNIKGNAFNTIPAGSYMLFMDKEGRRKVFIDGRLAYPQEFIMTYYHALKSAETFKSLDETYGFRYALAEYGTKPTWKFPFHLSENPEWALVSWDNAAALYLKRDAVGPGIIEKYAYKAVRPNFNRFNYLDRLISEGQSLLEAIDHDIALNPENQEAHLAKAYASYYLEEKDITIKELAIALSLSPDVAFEHISMAQMLLEAGDRRGAKKEALHALRLEPHNSEAKGLIALVDK